MVKKVLVVIMVCCILVTGCKKSIQPNVSDNIEESENETTGVGVFYEPIKSLSDLKQGWEGSGYTSPTLYYDKKMYSLIFNVSYSNDDNVSYDDFLDKEIGAVNGYKHTYWSQAPDDLYEVTDEGILFKVKQSEENNRLGIYSESTGKDGNTNYRIQIFENLSGIYLDKGSDLFKNRFNLSNSTLVKTYFSSEGVESAVELDINDEKIQNFINTLCEGTFIETSADEQPYDIQIVMFYDTMGINTDILIDSKGYVYMKKAGGYNITLQIDEQKCIDFLSYIKNI